MCELFAMSSQSPASVEFSLERLARHGGAEGPHRDGWGVAFYEDNDAFLLREPRAAADSQLVGYIEKNGPPSQLVISHIRRATHGRKALRNTQPFIRELGGHIHTFAHNGELDGIDQHPGFIPSRFRPVGNTDSELGFCQLLNRLESLWLEEKGVPALSDRFEIIDQFAETLREFGPANFLYSDGDALFAHAHQRLQADGRIAAPGLYLRERECTEHPQVEDRSAIIHTPLPQRVILLASVPLTEESWAPTEEGQIVVVKHGQLISP